MTHREEVRMTEFYTGFLRTGASKNLLREAPGVTSSIVKAAIQHFDEEQGTEYTCKLYNCKFCGHDTLITPAGICPDCGEVNH